MKLITKEIEKVLAKYPLYSQDGKGGDAKVVVKIFDPMGRATWYILEGEKLPDGDYELYGLCDLMEPEFGSVRLSELESLGGIPRNLEINGRVLTVPGLPMERDISVQPGKETLRYVYESTTGRRYPFDRMESFNAKRCTNCSHCGACQSRNEKAVDPMMLLGKDFFYLEKDRNGKVWIHVNGYFYEGEDEGDGPYRSVEYTGLMLDPERMRTEGSDYYDDMQQQNNQYIGDLTEAEVREELEGYLGAKPLRMSEVTDDMPIDGQWYYAEPYKSSNVKGKKVKKNKGQFKERPALFSKWRHKE